MMAESCVEAAAGPVAVGDPECARKNEEEAGELELAAHQPKAKERHVAIFEKEGAVFAVDGAGGIRQGNERQSEKILCRDQRCLDEQALQKEQEDLRENEE
ncbi:uncharacterized protein MONOS_4076 [Monocercomonoides exilis]|uniref:uncharacterized protein n=1 Tax=Monocercomonoides exilis TaxID=2049356 RepID=UPI0035598F35|nr:hypothetical protein MONOS_4076 [Monocercomonoides exilis]|eukprot:MONOS_4076.1-p1 / transcript=MONOS_4076.1 / gene=MONOS_4076 / organism=Monocercomonoides_exilis_PA203 / gene_product=unspecified product / transcript_product=unspecified product / location=Mono_scaffold00103:123517-123916(-) / protein_length=101 / sequence_SO=supercontig / SO=protein_coding / is_pseudo=false